MPAQAYNNDKRYCYLVVSNLPLGMEITSDYGNLVIEAFGTGSNMPVGQARTTHATGDGMGHTVTLALQKITDPNGVDIIEEKPERHLRVVR